MFKQAAAAGAANPHIDGFFLRCCGSRNLHLNTTLLAQLFWIVSHYLLLMTNCSFKARARLRLKKKKIPRKKKYFWIRISSELCALNGSLRASLTLLWPREPSSSREQDKLSRKVAFQRRKRPFRDNLSCSRLLDGSLGHKRVKEALRDPFSAQSSEEIRIQKYFFFRGIFFFFSLSLALALIKI